MNEETFLSALRADPADEVAWLALADWLDESGQPDRAELLRLVRRLISAPVMRRDKARAAAEGRVIALLAAGVRPAVPAVVNSIGMRLALVPAGRFRMGSPSGEKGRLSDEPAHEVRLTRPFYLGVFTVTQAQYRRVMKRSPSYFSAGGAGRDRVQGMDTGELPVEMVSWNEAVVFCDKLTALREEARAGRVYRLPTEAEWEYACRAGTSTRFYTGDAITSADANLDNALGRTCAGGAYKANAFGIHDLQGNVWEWCADNYDQGYYRHSPKDDPPGPDSGHGRLCRGSAFDDDDRRCRSACRPYGSADGKYRFVGFRVAADVEPGVKGG